MVRKKALLRSEFVEGVFEKLVIEYERQREKLMSSTMKRNEYEANLLQKEVEKLIYRALYLLMIYTKVQVSESKEITGIFDVLQRFLRLNRPSNS